MGTPLAVKKLPNEEEVFLPKPTVLFVANVSPQFSPKGMIRGFEQNGFDVALFDWQKVKFNEGVLGLRQRIVKKAMMEQPAFIFLHIQNPESITAEEAQQLQEIAPTFNYTFDVRDNIDWYKELAPFIQHTFFACQEDVNKAKKYGFDNVSLMQSSCDFELYTPDTLQEKGTMADIVFIGANYSPTNLGFPLAKQRQQAIDFLHQEYGDRFKAVGMNQKESRIVLHEEELNLIRQAKIVINYNNFDLTEYLSDRIWRSMATGAFVLSFEHKGIENIFEAGKHLDVFRTHQQLKQKVDYYLQDATKREAIAKQGMEYVRENHSWAKRFEALIDKIFA